MRLRYGVLLAASAVLVVSFFLPWFQAPCRNACGFADEGVLRFMLSSRTFGIDAWTAAATGVAALAAFALAAFCIAGLRSTQTRRAPIGTAAMLLGYFVAVAAVDLHHVTVGSPVFRGAGYAYGAYLGLVAVTVILVAAAELRRPTLARMRSLPVVLTSALAAALLILLVVLEWHPGPWFSTSLGGIGSGTVAAALTIGLLMAAWSSTPPSVPQVALALAASLFAVAIAVSDLHDTPLTLERSMLIGIAVALAATTVAAARPGMWRPGPFVIAAAAGAGLVSASLFLTWERACYPANSLFRPFAGECTSNTGAQSISISVAALLALGATLAIARAARPALWLRPIELVGGMAILLATAGFGLRELDTADEHVTVGYGPFVAFAGGAVLTALVLIRERGYRVDRIRIDARVAPVILCVAYIVVLVVPWWRVLPSGVQVHVAFPSVSWLTAAALLAAIWMLGVWTREVEATEDPSLVALPLLMLAPFAVDAVEQWDVPNWGWFAGSGLALLLLWLGHIERSGGLEDIRVPEILRIDRI
jgi:hypothetical protein